MTVPETHFIRLDDSIANLFLQYYFGCDFSDCCLHFYCCYLKHNVLVAVSSDLLQVSLVYLRMEIIQAGKSFLKFDC